MDSKYNKINYVYLYKKYKKKYLDLKNQHGSGRGRGIIERIKSEVEQLRNELEDIISDFDYKEETLFFKVNDDDFLVLFIECYPHRSPEIYINYKIFNSYWQINFTLIDLINNYYISYFRKELEGLRHITDTELLSIIKEYRYNISKVTEYLVSDLVKKLHISEAEDVPPERGAAEDVPPERGAAEDVPPKQFLEGSMPDIDDNDNSSWFNYKYKNPEFFKWDPWQVKTFSEESKLLRENYCKFIISFNNIPDYNYLNDAFIRYDHKTRVKVMNYLFDGDTNIEYYICLKEHQDRSNVFFYNRNLLDKFIVELNRYKVKDSSNNFYNIEILLELPCTWRKDRDSIEEQLIHILFGSTTLCKYKSEKADYQFNPEDMDEKLKQAYLNFIFNNK
jgi:hypothetical protein